MANGPTITSAAGARRCQVFTLNSSGYPDGDQSGATPYDGFDLEGFNSFTPNLPGVRRVQHVGNDRLIAQDYLPAVEGASATITTAKMNLAADAILTDTSTSQVGETTMGGMLTNHQGDEKDVCVIIYRQALATAKGASQVRRWQMHVFPVGRLIPGGGSAQDGGADENSYEFVATVATAPPWGHTFTEVDEGFTEAQYLRFTAENPAMMDSWDGNGTLATFNLTFTPISVAKTSVIVNGTAAVVSSVDTSAKSVTISAPAANAAKVVAWYETSDPI